MFWNTNTAALDFMWKRSFVFIHISTAFKTCLCILNFFQAFEALTYEVVLQTAPGKVKEDLIYLRFVYLVSVLF